MNCPSSRSAQEGAPTTFRGLPWKADAEDALNRGKELIDLLLVVGAELLADAWWAINNLIVHRDFPLFAGLPHDAAATRSNVGSRRWAAARFLALGLVVTGSPAVADPCKAIPDRGPMPAYLAKGETFSGPVVYIGDGDSLCVQARPGGPAGSVEVRVADFYAIELNAPGGRQEKAILERIAMGKHAACTAQKRSYDRVVAVCRIGGVSVGKLMVDAGAVQGGRGR